MTLTPAQERLRVTAGFLAWLHFGAGTSYLLLQRPLLEFCNFAQEKFLGGAPFWQPIGLPQERFWFTLSLSMMYMIWFLAWECSRDVVENIGQVRTIILSKAVSTAFFIVFFFTDARALAYIVGIVVDGSLLALVWWLYATAAASVQKE